MTVIVTEKKIALHSQAMSSGGGPLRKTRAVRNLFGTKVDNRELQDQIDQLEENNRDRLNSYECESVIGIIVFSNTKRKRSRTLNNSRISLENLVELERGSERNTGSPLLLEQVNDNAIENRNVLEVTDGQMNKSEQSVEEVFCNSSKIKPTKKLVGQTTLKGTYKILFINQVND
ncbi:unnamed protein product [Diamesa serratosioi]